MVGFRLRNTLSKNGTVTRGVCKIDGASMLEEIEETYEIEAKGDHAVAQKAGTEIRLDLESPVSMNMWGLPASFLKELESGFPQFLSEIKEGDIKSEYLLPKIIDKLVEQGRARVKVLETPDKWFGVTYKEDKQAVVNSLKALIARGDYPETLY